jgi:hypothetical protein
MNSFSAPRIIPLAALLLSACGIEPSQEIVGHHALFLSSVDCTESSDTGYTSGKSFAITVVQVDGKKVERETANAYYVMATAAAADGVTLRIVSGFRTNAQQTYLYNCYQNAWQGAGYCASCNNCNLAAKPGYSNHQSGHALDLNTSDSGVCDWLTQNGATYGFERTVPSEKWHWEWWGGGPGGGPCQGEPCDEIAGQGGIVEETGNCFHAYGDPTYWRKVEAEGHGQSLLWTNALQNASPSNWAKWELNFSESGVYRLEYFATPAYAVFNHTRYDVAHNAQTTTLKVDQSQAQSGWNILGEYYFAGDGTESLKVFDNTDQLIADDQHIVVDALRLTRIDSLPIDAGLPPVDSSPPIDAGGPEYLDAGGYWVPPVQPASGCSISNDANIGRGWAFLLFACFGIWVRRSTV